jgi:hypothetical protein
MSPTPNPRINTGWRTNTLAEKPGHRHEHTQAAWKPSDGYIQQPGSWRRFSLGVLMVFLACLAFAVEQVMDIAAKLAHDLRAAANYIDTLGGVSGKYRQTLAQYEQAKPAEQLPHGLLEEAARLASEHQSGPWEMQVRYTLRRFLEVFAAPVAQAEPWIPVNERLPEMPIMDSWRESPPLLVYEAKFGKQRVATYEQVCEDEPPRWYSACSERWSLDHVTHWMPLPQPPKENQL